MRGKLLPILLLAGFLGSEARERGVHVVREAEGQTYYLSACAACHGEGKILGNMATQREWRELLSHHAQGLMALHRGENNTTTVIRYLGSDQYTKEKRKLLRFLQEFASDSPDIPTCY